MYVLSGWTSLNCYFVYLENVKTYSSTRLGEVNLTVC